MKYTIEKVPSVLTIKDIEQGQTFMIEDILTEVYLKIEDGQHVCLSHGELYDDELELDKCFLVEPKDPIVFVEK